MKRLVLFSFLIAALTTCGQGAVASTFGQAAGEREAQKALPQSRSPLWTTLSHTKIGEDAKHGVFTAHFPEDVKALDGRTITLSGFMLPLDATTQSHHFLLAKYTPVCFFCPPGMPNEVVEVTTRSGTPITGRMFNVTGRLKLIDNGEKGLFFQLDQASVS